MGDGDLDLAVANSGDLSGGDTVSVLLNSGDGTFAPHVLYGAGGFPSSVAVGDLDGDLDLDLAVANVASDAVSVLLNNGDGTFAANVLYGAGAGSCSVALGDLDFDLDLDLVVANRHSDNVSVLLNNCPPAPSPADITGPGGVPDGCPVREWARLHLLGTAVHRWQDSRLLRTSASPN